ncbi:hypothetical protein ACH5RR_030899 [Cinchona calisaya]|uniref:Uncharacterized protein n=1 Tax=Cinchona calisaya TaxID=153742 RepID=A0ABD2YW16_9GENT
MLLSAFIRDETQENNFDTYNSDVMNRKNMQTQERNTEESKNDDSQRNEAGAAGVWTSSELTTNKQILYGKKEEENSVVDWIDPRISNTIGMYVPLAKFNPRPRAM